MSNLFWNLTLLKVLDGGKSKFFELLLPNYSETFCGLLEVEVCMLVRRLGDMEKNAVLGVMASSALRPVLARSTLMSGREKALIV